MAQIGHQSLYFMCSGKCPTNSAWVRCSADISQVSHALLLTPQRCWLLQLWHFSLSSPFASPPTRSPLETPKMCVPRVLHLQVPTFNFSFTLNDGIVRHTLRTHRYGPHGTYLSFVGGTAEPKSESSRTQALLDIQSALPGERNSFALALVLHKASCAVNATLVSHIRPLS